MSSERNARIIEAYASGMTLAAVGESFGISRQRVQAILVRAGVERRKRGSSPKHKVNVALVVQEYTRLLSVYEVSKRVGCAQSTVYGILSRAGVKVVRRSKFDELPMETIKSRYEAGERLDSIAESLGMRSNYLNNLLRRYGVPARSKRGRKPRVAPGETAVDIGARV